MVNKMSICIIKYTYTRYVGVDIGSGAEVRG